jgi:hypothetical protein
MSVKHSVSSDLRAILYSEKVFKIPRRLLCDKQVACWSFDGRVQLKCDGTRWRTGGEVKGKLAIGVCTNTLHTTSEHGVPSITTADAHTSVASNRLKWRPRRFKWTRPFRQKTKSGFCACAITFQTQSTLRRRFQNCRWKFVVVNNGGRLLQTCYRNI